MTCAFSSVCKCPVCGNDYSNTQIVSHVNYCLDIDKKVDELVAFFDFDDSNRGGVNSNNNDIGYLASPTSPEFNQNDFSCQNDDDGNSNNHNDLRTTLRDDLERAKGDINVAAFFISEFTANNRRQVRHYKPQLEGHDKEKTITSAGKEKTITIAGKEETITSAGKEETITSAGKEEAITSAGKEETITITGNEVAITSAGKKDNYDTTATVACQNGNRVEIAIYDLMPNFKIAKKLGVGVYHTGVIVFGSEVAFGGSINLAKDTGKSGIWSASPGTAAGMLYRRLLIGETFWSANEVHNLLLEWGRDQFTVDKYNILHNNCNTFASFFLAKLGERGRLLPGSCVLVKDDVSVRNNVNGNISASNHNNDHALLPPQILDSVSYDPQRVKEGFKIPAWVNRAANVGAKFVPNFVLRKVMQALGDDSSNDDSNDESHNNVIERRLIKNSKNVERVGCVSPCVEPFPSPPSLNHYDYDTIQQNEYETVMFLLDALGVEASDAVRQLGPPLISTDTTAASVPQLLPSGVFQDVAFMRLLNALRMNNGDVNAVLEFEV